MTDRIDEAMADAMRRLAYTGRQGVTFTLSAPRPGYWCGQCQSTSLHAADVLRIDESGVTAVAAFYACANC